MEINETFVRTSKNYGINSFVVAENTFLPKNKIFNGFSTNFDGIVLHGKAIPLSPICTDSKIELENPNISLELNIEKNYTSPIILNFDFSQGDTLVDTIKINVKDGVTAKFLITYTSNKNAYHNGFITFDCEKNSNIDCVLICDLSYESDNFLNIENTLKENSKLKFTIVDFAGKTSVSRFLTDITGNNASSQLKMMYIGEKEGKIDLNFAQNIYGKNSYALIKTIGALQDNSQKNFKGLIDFKKGASKSKGVEEELCLTLSKNAKSKALPLLCCGEENVDGSHSSATGKIGDKELFYIMSRGLSKAEGLKLLLKAKFTKVLNDVFDENIKSQIYEKIDRKIINEDDRF